ncbi:MAG: hypothetical protein A3A51_04565 [Candidatus Levybacteria bacterium RIFCSPLOWO2_01_FULL_39_10]|nr:MAG: hypothetical protein A3A51_04565 [Candidatus Levybacteria bacterium RIFCSPLOWO2_01_FULL_39_10]
MLTYEATPGQDIGVVVRRAVQIATHIGEAINLTFEGIQIPVKPNDSVASVKTAYRYAESASRKATGIEIFIKLPPGEYLELDDPDIDVIVDRLSSRLDAEAIRDRVTNDPIQRADGAWGFRIGATTGELATAVEILQDRMGFEIVDYNVVS